jgi:hypothetical protein
VVALRLRPVGVVGPHVANRRTAEELAGQANHTHEGSAVAGYGAGRFNRYPWVALGVVVVAVIWAAVVVARDRTLGERVGAIVADDDR